MQIDAFDYKRARNDTEYWQEWNALPERVQARHTVLKLEIRDNIKAQNETKALIDKLDERITNAIVRHVVDKKREIGDGRDFNTIAPKSRIAREQARNELHMLEKAEDILFAELFALESMFPVYFVVKRD